MSKLEINNAPVNETITRNDQYIHLKIREEDNPELAHEAWRIHSEGYLNMRFITKNAITTDGYIHEDIDSSRKENTDYYLAINKEGLEDDRATLRKINLKPGETYRDLPAFKLCKDVITEDNIQILDSIANQDQVIKEIAGLARTANSNPNAAYELFRNIYQEALGKNEIWFYSIVSSTYRSLAKNFTADNLKVLGDPIAINDSRVSQDITLVPVILQPDIFTETILKNIKENDTSLSHKRFMRTFLFFTDGLDENRMSPEVYTARKKFLHLD